MEAINKYIEHTLLKPTATEAEIKNLIADAIKYEFLGVCVNPTYVSLAKKLVGDNDIKIVTVVNFPLANNVIDITLAQVELALKDGADEIDTVVNLYGKK